MHKWYVIQAVSGQENKVKRVLEENRESQGMAELIEEVLVPSENVAEVKQGKQKVMERRLWPGYIILKMTLTDDSWMYIKNTNGVLGFLGGDPPTPLTEKEVDQILKEAEGKKGDVVQKYAINVGDRVKINDGVFINFVGGVIEVFHDKGRLSVMVSIFGRETRVDDLEFWQVELVPEESEIS